MVSVDSDWQSKFHGLFLMLSTTNSAYIQLASLKETTIRQIHMDHGLTNED